MAGEEWHVLIIEDERGLIDLFEIWLGGDYVTTTATSGEAARSHLDESVDVVVLDWRLPDGPGSAILDHLDERGLDPGVAVVTGAEPKGENVGDRVDLVLEKPIDRASFRGAIEDLVGEP